MADDKSRAEKLAAARKKAEKLKAKKKAEKHDTHKAKEEEDKAHEEAEAHAAEVAEKPESPSPASPTRAAEPEKPAGPSPTSTAALEAKLQELEKECAEAKAARDEAQLTADALEKKVASLEALHREDESHVHKLEGENRDLRSRLDVSEAEALRLRKKEAQDGGGTDNEHLDELEDEERQRMSNRIRELESENSELKRGIWHERRREMQVGMDEAAAGPGSGSGFTNVDLGGGGGASPSAHRKQQGGGGGGGGGIGGLLSSGINALAGGGAATTSHDDEFLDDDADFDEEAFRKAQEDAAKARLERIKEAKRALPNWKGYRLDLVDGRSGGGEGIGEIFDI